MIDSEIDFSWLIVFVFVCLLLAIFIDIYTSNRTSLHQATIDGNYQRVKQQLDRGINPDITKNSGMTPLFYAIEHNQIEIVQLLLDYGANINADVNGKLLLPEYSFNPLLYSLIRERQEITELLIDRGAERGIHYFCAMGDRSIVANYLINTPELINSKRNGLGLLHFAVFSKNLELIDLLLEYGSNVNDFSKRSGTPLHQAIVRQDLDLLKHLIALGANLEIPYGKSTPLTIAVSTNNKLIVELLIASKSNLNPTGFDISYPLLAAVERGHLEIASILLENGANINQRYNVGKTLLHTSVFKNDILMTDLLIHYGANVNAASYFGSTPLGLSHSRRGHEKIEKLLLQYGATDYGIDD